MKNLLSFTYTHKGEYAFLKRLVIEDIVPDRTTVWTLELQEVLLN